MARRPFRSLVEPRDDTRGGRPGLSREVIRLAIALVLLLVAGISSTLTGPALGGGTVRASVHTGSLFFGRGRTSRESEADALRAAVAGLQRRDRAFRLIAGLESVAPSVPARGAAGGPATPASTLWAADQTAARQAYGVPVDLALVVNRTRLLPFSWREAEDSLLEYRDRLESTPSILPARGYIGSGFTPARMHPILDLRRPHRGIDVVAPYGTAIVATAQGRVSFVGQSGAYGLTIEVDHGRGIMTRYAHASRALVCPGQEVARGDTIARVGRSGLAVGSHVHYEVLVNGEPRNPRHYILNPILISD